MPRTPRRFALLALAGLTLVLGACSSSRPVTTGATPAPGGAPTPPPEAMAGRWLLAGTGSSQCNMTLGGTVGTAEGTIAPEGGCPGAFFTSRKWTYEQGSLVIRDHNGQPLAQLAQVAAGRFEGKATDGLQVTLTR